jgi:hypothetical protein
MANPRYAAAFQHSHAVAWMKLFVGLLYDCQQGAAVEFDSQFQAIFSGGFFFDR